MADRVISWVDKWRGVKAGEGTAQSKEKGGEIHHEAVSEARD